MPITDRMPTAAKMAAAICLCGTAWYASQVFRRLMPEGTGFGWFDYTNTILGMACGWFVIGTRVGRSYRESVSAGLTGVAALVVWSLLLHSLGKMLSHALQRRYDGPVEGIVAIFEIGIDYGLELLDVPMIGILVVGGILSGLVAEWVSRRWS